MSSQVDSRSQSAGKRARTDGSRREDDWVCPSCKNVNFAFRTTCNMRSCNQPRPADHTAMQKPMLTPPRYAASGGYMSPGTPPSMYLGGGAPPYGSSMFNGPAMPPRYGIPQFPGSSAYPYGYGGRIPMGSPYGPMQMAGPPPYAGGSMMGAGGMYGMHVDRYSLIPASPGAMGTRPGSYDEGSQKKPAGAGRDNDWECPNCHNINFAFRAVCNMRKCNTPRPENQGSKPDGSRGSKPKMPEGSWKCEQCNNINYPFRTKCNRPQCGAEKPPQTNNTNDSATDQDNQESSSGDNAAIVGDAVAVEEEASEGSMAGQGEASRNNGDLDWSSDDDSSDEDYEELYKALDDWSSEDESTTEAYAELYKALDDAFGHDEPDIVQAIKQLSENSRRGLKLLKKAVVRGMYEESINRHVRGIKETGAEFVERTLRSTGQCYNIFRMRAHVFESLHEELVSKYGLKSTRKCSSREALGIFLYMVGPPQPVRQADSMFEMSMGTISRKFNHVLSCVTKLAKDIIAPKDRTFTSVHPKVANHGAAPFFNNAIGALDGTHVKVVAPFEKVGQYINRKNDETQNVLAICDFDLRFTFVVAGVPGSAHDWPVLQAAMRKYESDYPHPPTGKFYLVDAGYPNRPGYLAPYKGFKYHQEQWRRGPAPSGEKELFNKAHSSLRSVIEQSFGMLKMKWRILLAVPCYQEGIQSDIIIACCALHNYVIDHDDDDIDLAISTYLGRSVMEDTDEEEPECHDEADEAEDDINMNVVRDEIAHAYYMSQQRR